MFTVLILITLVLFGSCDIVKEIPTEIVKINETVATNDIIIHTPTEIITDKKVKTVTLDKEIYDDINTPQSAVTGSKITDSSATTEHTKTTESTILPNSTEAAEIMQLQQAIAVTPTTEVTEIEPVYDEICKQCVCANQTVDCHNKELKTAFELSDWDGLQTFSPLIVDMSYNSLTTFTRISSLPTIQHLNLSNSQIADIEYATFSYLRNLVSLDLSNNQLTSSSVNGRVFVGIIDPKAGIIPFSKMRHLSLANNEIHSLSQDVFVFMNQLTSLDLSGNALGYMDQVTMAAITDLINLEDLNLSDCQLETLPEGLFRRLRSLKRLDLNKNKFTTVPPVLAEATNLVYLDFGGNLVETLNQTTAISSLTKLQELRLCGLSKLTRIADGALGGLESLVSLHVCFNPRLTVVEDGFLAWKEDQFEHELWPKLEELRLNNNNLSRLYSAYLSSWDRLTEMDFGYNPYLCDCTNQWIIDVLIPLIKNSGSNATVSNMVCMTPKEMRGISFVQLNNASKILTCQEMASIKDSSGPDMAILLGVMIGIFTTFPLVLIVILLWRNGYFTRCRMKRIDSSSDDEENDAF